MEYRLRRHDGEYRWIDDHGVPRFSADGEFEGYIGSCIDIHDSKQINAERDRLLRIIEEAPDFIATSDMQAHLKFLNNAGARLVGLPVDVDLTPLEIKDMHPEWGTRLVLEEGVPTVLRQGFWQHENALLDRNDGREIPVSQLLLVHRDADGTPQLLSTIMRDITDSKRAEQALQQENEKNLALLRNASDGIHILDIEGNIIEASNSFCAMLGYRRDEVIGMHVSRWDAGFADDEVRMAAVRQQFENPLRSQFETRHRRKDGTIFDVEVSGIPLKLAGQSVLFNSSRDITERKHAEESLQLASLVYQNSSEAMMVTDANGIIITINPAFTRLTGYSEQEAIGQNTSILNTGHHDREFFQTMWRDLSATGHWQGEIWNKRKDGEVFVEWLSINAILNADGSVQRCVALFSDVTEKKKSEELIWKQANYDSLTGLPNRRMFHERLEQEFKKAHRVKLPLALLFLDLDHFKEVNDTLGHDMGDLLLKEATQRITSCVRETDTVARLGGDEFTLILGELEEPDSVERIANSIVEKLAKPFQLGTELAQISASIGIAIYPNDAMDVSSLLKNADLAMYAAKRQGRNQFHFYTSTMLETEIPPKTPAA
jgi:diguanylate cyclase (GGDEF)-like protein/PAS domain S-box-containing protein